MDGTRSVAGLEINVCKRFSVNELGYPALVSFPQKRRGSKWDRAGEAGRGFSVVAYEVRKLAEQSSEAAGNISALIAGIQQDTHRAVTSIEEGNRNVAAGAETIASTGEAFKDIEKQVDLLGEHIRGSIRHIKAVEGTSQSILSSMGSVQELSRRSEEEAQSISAATQEQSAVMHEMAGASEKLAGLAQALQKEVSKFKV